MTRIDDRNHSPGANPNIVRDATRAARAGVESDLHHGSVMPPIHLSANFAFESFGRKRRYDYTRSGNPTRDELGSALADLEQGAGAVVTSSGLAAITLCLEAFLATGDLVVAPHDGYGGTYRLLRALAKKNRIRLDLVDQGDPAALAAAPPRETKIGMDRDSQQSAAPRRRHRGDRGRGARRRGARRGRQHLSFAGAPETAPPRRRRRRPLDRQVSERPRRRDRRRRDRQG